MSLNPITFLTRTRRQGRIGVTDVLAWLWLILGTLAVLVPVVWAGLSSMKPAAEITRFPPTLLPHDAVEVTVKGYDKPLSLWQVSIDGTTRQMAMVRRIGLKAQMVDPENPQTPVSVDTRTITPVQSLTIATENYTDPLTRFAFLTFLKNSVFVTVVATALTLIVNALAAFALSKYRFRGDKAVFVLIISTLMIPLTVVMVPAYLVIVGVGLVDNLWGVIIPTIASPTGVFLLRQYMLTIPDELIEAARVDAASEFRIFWRIVLPLTAPALAVLAIFSVLWRWNDFLWPLIVLSSRENFTLQVGLNAFQGEFSVQWNYILAMTFLSLMPVTLVFLFLQKYITTGIAGTGMK
ncbi:MULTISPECIES: carbohydrate ABC transporter permease [Rhizobium/Agrobacterium group]|uniref:ABC transporter membrane spanning protein (Sugar) n=2 Tax=Rhizobium/Agrobacterium group TaxID=227290 RepID=B9K1T7_ALLAM|nr:MULTISPECIES: carbohydrate ABC transporter permease [Rhizobium/Agrobacterium group]ACM38835.1 ABC transporter membrane spanning protein (sugar) [Allorhizobium ampelinum S4]MCF1446002.1 carbohydrate ABC transporter permease [Allorhizobium ampelinum]MCF1491006.1 carbohydrate ABC transporter permease [Allorhizobium ampelinum]MUO26466.1 ABC transporter permease subunit [Agrobacterium vitis]MUO41579.1 ABC transporter permease subunit [Agrobacterium vitis]